MGPYAYDMHLPLTGTGAVATTAFGSMLSFRELEACTSRLRDAHKPQVAIARSIVATQLFTNTKPRNAVRRRSQTALR
jgi:hypothetical protein